MNNSKDYDSKKYTCPACMGSCKLYNHIADNCYTCKYCNGKGVVTDGEKEWFLSTILTNKQ